MRQAKDFDHAIRADTVNHQMARPTDALLRGDKMTAEPERIDTGTGDFPRAKSSRELCHGREHGAHKPVVAGGGFEAPVTGTAKQDAIDVVLSAAEKPVVQREASVASRMRKRSMAASCNTSLSAPVLTVT